MEPPRPSKELLAFTNKSVYDRAPILRFVQSAATTLPAGARVLDAGSGRAPYRELFTAFEYVTADWPNSPHAEAEQADITCSLEAIPVADTSFDDVLCTQVLEHVPEPRDVVREPAPRPRSGRTAVDDGALRLGLTRSRTTSTATASAAMQGVRQRRTPSGVPRRLRAVEIVEQRDACGVPDDPRREV